MSTPQRPFRALPRARPRWLAGVFVLGFLAILARDVQVQVLQVQHLRAQGQMRYLRTRPLPAQRGVIFAANGLPLAVNTAASTIWGDPKILGKYQSQWPRLAQVLGLSVVELGQRLASGGADFAYLARQQPPGLGTAVRALHIPGVGVLPSSRTYFPLGAATTPLIGLVDQAHRGATGMELSYNSWLAAHPGSEQAVYDGRGQVVQVLKVGRLSRPGHAIHLSIEPQMQYWAYMALIRSLRHFHAQDGSAVLMNVHTGAILAMVSAPSCNPNQSGACRFPADYVNNAVHQAFEPGSVMKPFAIAAALASGSVSPTQKFHVFHPLWVGGYPITDDVPHHILNIEHILKYSSCIGTAKIALRTPERTLYNMYRAVGFGRIAPLGLPGETAGVLPPWQSWGIARHATISIGYGVSVTTLQLAAAYASIANGGWYVRPTLFAGAGVHRHRVMPAWVANDLRRWLQSVARPGGTGILAAIPGYAVGGKTGTANMANGKDGFYHHRTNATFVGFAPGPHPDLVMAVNLRGSHFAWNFGGIEAAPVFRFTMRRALRTLDVPPRCNTGGKFLEIRVPSGADLHELALRYHSTSRYLMQINQLTSPQALEAGAFFKVPMPLGEKDFCRVQTPAVSRAQAEIWSEGGG
jgi:cell division protein FtsI (penicillin-binding protein 3)